MARLQVLRAHYSAAMGRGHAPGRRVRDDVPRANGRQAWAVVAAVLANLAFLTPAWMAFFSSEDHVRVLTTSFAGKCVRTLPGKTDLPYSFAEVRFQRPYVLRLTWSHTSTVVLCEYDPGDGDEEPESVVRAWVAER